MPLLPLPCALRRSLWFVFAPLLAWTVGPGLSAQTAAPIAADGFNPFVTGTVTTMAVQADGKIIIGGIFSGVRPAGSSNTVGATGLARLNPDGTLDASFTIPTFTNATNPGLAPQVNAVAVQPDGKILVGGNLASGSLKNLVRLNADGTIDLGFNPRPVGNVDGVVTAIAIETPQNMPGQTSVQILIGGNFTSLTANAGTVTRNHIARLNLDSSVDTTFDPNADAQVDAFGIETATGQILIGGAFNNMGGATSGNRHHIARLSNTGALDAGFDPNANGQVTQFAIEANNRIIIVGGFSTLNAGNANAAFIARLNYADGSVDPSFTAQASAPIQTVGLQANGQIVIGGSIGSITSAAGFTLSHQFLVRINPDGSPDPSFLVQPNSNVNALVVQPSGAILIAGNFTQVKSPSVTSATNRAGLARVTADGYLDTDFDPNAQGGLGAIAVQPDGKILIGGAFTSIGGRSIANLARLNIDGTLDTTFVAPNPDGPVSALALQSDGKILVGGSFFNIAGTQRPYLARLTATGALDTAYYPNPGSPVAALAVTSSGQLIVGGSFLGFTPNPNSTTPVSTNVSYAARINADGTVDTTFLPNPSAPVGSILLEPSDNAILLGGQFSTVSPVSTGVTSSAPFIVRLNATNGSYDPNFVIFPNGPINSMALQSDGNILIAGNFGFFTTTTTVGITTTTVNTTRQGIARLHFKDGSLDTTFNASADGDVFSILLTPDQHILAAGLFKNIAGNSQAYLARLNNDGTFDNTFLPVLNGVASVLAPQLDSTGKANGQILVGGAFTSVGFPNAAPILENHLARFNASTVAPGSLDTAFSPPTQFGATVNAIALQPNGEILAGGSFTNIGGTYGTFLTRFWPDSGFDNGTSTRGGFGPNPNGPVNSLLVESNASSLYVGGSFSAIGGTTASNLARVNPDGTLDGTFVANTDGPVYAMALQTDGKLVVGGQFSHLNGASAINVVRVIGQTGVFDTTFTAFTNGKVETVVIQPNGQILIGGTFSSVDGTPRANLARLNANGDLDLSFSPNPAGEVSALALQPDGAILVGGAFAGSAQPYLARLQANGLFDGSFAATVNGPVRTIVLENPSAKASAASSDLILIGGTFTTVDGAARNNAARLNPNGTLDPIYNPNPNGTVNAIAIGVDGKTYLGGSFTSVGGLSRSGLARLGAVGAASQVITADPTFNTLTWTLSGEVPELANVIFQVSPDTNTWTNLGQGVRNGTLNSWSISGVGPSLPNGVFYIRTLSAAFTSQGSTVSEVGWMQQLAGSPLSYVASSNAVSAVAGSIFSFQIAATNSPTKFSSTALPPGLTLDPTTGIISGTPTAAGITSVVVTAFNATGSTTSTITFTVVAAAPGPVAPTARLLNLSSSVYVDPLDPLSEGFIIAPGGPKAVLIRAIGPTLSAFTAAIPLDQPALTVYNASGQVLLTGYHAGTSPAVAQVSAQINAAIAQITAQVGAFPLGPNSFDTVVATVLPPGNYTVKVTSADGNSGLAMAEVYDADTSALRLSESQHLSNVSSSGNVIVGTPLTAGFVVGGSGPKKLLIRGVGPQLALFGVPNTLGDPVLSVYDSTRKLIAQNKGGWTVPFTANATYPAVTGQTIKTDAAALSAFAFIDASLDSALEITLNPGVYTAQVTSASGATGNAMIEVYDFQ